MEELAAVASEAGKTPAQVALNWVKDRPGVTAPIIGARSLAQLEENLGSTGWSLAAGQIGRLNKISEQPAPIYPHGFVNGFQRA